jgi:hypothetical protein
VLIGKTLEQSLMEVMEEEELAAMRAHQASLLFCQEMFLLVPFDIFESLLRENYKTSEFVHLYVSVFG